MLLSREVFPHQSGGAAVSITESEHFQDILACITELIIFSKLFNTLKLNGSLPFSSQPF